MGLGKIRFLDTVKMLKMAKIMTMTQLDPDLLLVRLLNPSDHMTGSKRSKIH